MSRDDEAQIQHIVDNKLLNKAGGLYKTSLIVANCRVVVEAEKRLAELEKKAKAMVERKRGRQRRHQQRRCQRWPCFMLHLTRSLNGVIVTAAVSP